MRLILEYWKNYIKENKEEPFYVRATGKKVKGRRSDDEKFRSMAHYVIIHRPSNTYVDSSLYRPGRTSVQALAKELNKNFGHLKVNEETGKLEGEDVTAILDFILNSEFRNPQAGLGNCPPATQDLELNTKNRDSAIHAEHIQYGPLNVDKPGDYWKDIAEYWNTTEEAAKASKCGNCTAFDISPRMKDCMPGETSDDDGELGYCWMHHFKCHSARSCRTWAKGGPIDEDSVSADWQDRSNIGKNDETPA